MKYLHVSNSMNKKSGDIMKTYLIIGGCGFIGSNFIRLLVEQEPEVHILIVDAFTYNETHNNLYY